MLKRIILSTAVIFGLLIFTGCSSDDDNNENGDPTSGEPYYGVSEIKLSGDISRTYSGNAVFSETSMGSNLPDFVSIELFPKEEDPDDFEIDFSLINVSLDNIEETVYNFNLHSFADPGVQAPHVFINYNEGWIELHEDSYLSEEEGYFKITSISNNVIEGEFVVFLEAYLDDSEEDLEIKAKGTFKAGNAENLNFGY